MNAKEVIAKLTAHDPATRPVIDSDRDVMPWAEQVALMRSGKVCRIDRAFCDYWLEVLPPHYMAYGVFTFAEGAEPAVLFWREDKTCLCRQLTEQQTREFCAAVGVEYPN